MDLTHLPSPTGTGRLAPCEQQRLPLAGRTHGLATNGARIRRGLKAKGILGYVSTHRDGWRVTVAGLVRSGCQHQRAGGRPASCAVGRVGWLEGAVGAGETRWRQVMYQPPKLPQRCLRTRQSPVVGRTRRGSPRATAGISGDGEPDTLQGCSPERLMPELPHALKPRQCRWGLLSQEGFTPGRERGAQAALGVAVPVRHGGRALFAVE